MNHRLTLVIALAAAVLLIAPRAGFSQGGPTPGQFRGNWNLPGSAENKEERREDTNDNDTNESAEESAEARAEDEDEMEESGEEHWEDVDDDVIQTIDAILPDSVTIK